MTQAAKTIREYAKWEEVEDEADQLHLSYVIATLGR